MSNNLPRDAPETMTRFSLLCVYPPSTVARYRTIPDDCDLRNHVKRDTEGGRGSDLTWSDKGGPWSLVSEYCRTHATCIRTISCDPSLPSLGKKGMEQPAIDEFGDWSCAEVPTCREGCSGICGRRRLEVNLRL